MSLFMAFLIGFWLGGVAGCNSPRSNTNTPPPIQPNRLRKYK